MSPVSGAPALPYCTIWEALNVPAWSGVMLDGVVPTIWVWILYGCPSLRLLNWKIAEEILLRLMTISPSVSWFLRNADLSRDPSSIAGSTNEEILRADSLTLPRTLIRTGELNVLRRSCASPPLTVMYSLNVTGVSNVVTRLPRSSSSVSYTHLTLPTKQAV